MNRSAIGRRPSAGPRVRVWVWVRRLGAVVVACVLAQALVAALPAAAAHTGEQSGTRAHTGVLGSCVVSLVGPGGGFDVTYAVNEVGNLTQGPAGIYIDPTPGDGVARGQRALLQEGSIVTLTLDSWAERTAASGGLTERRWYTLAGTVAAVQQRTPTGAVSWNIVLGDIRGSAAVTIARGTTTITSQWWTPYGERRGTRNDPIGTRGYLNQPEDSASGLTYLNARYHDPRLGIFLSVDPLITTTNEPYLYASGNPTTLSDPTGLMALPGGEWLCEGGGVQGCGSHAVKDRVYNAKKNLWDDLHGRARTPGVIGSGCHIGTDSQGRCKQMSGLRPISTLTDLFFDPDACRGFSWSCVIEIAGIIPYGKILKVGKLATTLTKTTDRLSNTADTAHDINKATNTADDLVGLADDDATVVRPASTPWGRTVQDFQVNGDAWSRVSAHAEAASGQIYRGGTSIEEVFTSGDQWLVRHQIYDSTGNLVHETFRPYAKFGAG